MLGLLILLILSWTLLYLIEKRSILALGFLPVQKRAGQFTVGIIISGVLCTIAQYLEAFLQDSNWIVNENLSSSVLLESIQWDFVSVLTEELVFRGALLIILVRIIGAKKAVLISAASFGVYHWFSYGVIGNPAAMIFVFIGTGLMGYAWAWAFAKTKSIMLPFGLHLGWNVVYNSVFSKGPLGEMLLTTSGGNELTGWTSLFNFSIGLIVVPVLVLLYVKLFVKEEDQEMVNAH